ncbi:MAG: DUF7673 family protein [Pseudomonadaceae bacterium]|jgi:hypothetical protein
MSSPLVNLAAKLLAEEQNRREAFDAGLPALQRLVPIALGDTGQSMVVGRFLLGLFSSEYPFHLNTLRALDLEIFRDCLAVLQLDRYPEKDIHLYLVDGPAVFEKLKQRWTANGGAQ